MWKSRACMIGLDARDTRGTKKGGLIAPRRANRSLNAIDCERR